MPEAGPDRIEVRSEVELGRRSLKHWGRGRDCWFFDLTEAHCDATGVDTGDAVSVELLRTDQGPPEEILSLIAESDAAAATWDAMSTSRRRQAAEHVRSARRPETRVVRARKILEGA